MLTKEIDKSGRDIELEIDGGINFDNIQEVIDAGANVIVAGTTAFQDGPSEYANNIKRLRGQ
jgi:ribulose-phosphate 3-epimerase